MARYKILLVDDEKNILTSLARVFRDGEYDISTAENAEAAVDMVHGGEFDLIICDYKMPGMNGIEFFEIISGEHPEIIKILLTGSAELNMAIEAINKATLYKFILKPWDNSDLLFTVKRALEHKSLLEKNMKLMNEVKRRDEILIRLEKENPGILEIKRDDTGAVVIN